MTSEPTPPPELEPAIVNTTIEAFYLGTMADLDPDETNYVNENAGNLVGMSFGEGAAAVSDGTDQGDAYALFGPPETPPLYESIISLTLEDGGNDGRIYSNDAGTAPISADDRLSYDGSSQGLDSVTIYNVTITYSDGSTANVAMIVLQDVDGRVFLAPNVAGSASSALLDDHPIASVHIDSVADDYLYGVGTNLTQDAFITCFVQGSLIETSQGAVDVATLAVGDLVQTMDNGLQPIRWIGGRRVRAAGHLRPVQVSVGALGCGLPTHDLQVSPQHRILLRSRIAERMFGTPEVLIAAKKLLGITGIDLADGEGFVTNWHILFEHHEIIFAHGVASESLYLGPQAQQTLGAEAVAEIQQLFPEFAAQFESPKAARPIIQGKHQKQLMQRHIKNSQDVFQPM